MTTTDSPTVTCPAWCRTDHDAERARDAAQDAETHAYIRQQDPTWQGGGVISDTVLHSRVVGEMPVRAGRDDVGTLTLKLQECAQDGDGPVLYVQRDRGDDFTPAEAAAFAGLLAIGRRMLADADGTTARRDALEAARQAHLDALTPPAVPPCPSWCTEPSGHDYDGVVDDETFLRFHSTDTGEDAMAALVQQESNRAGVVTLGEPEVDTSSFIVLGRTHTAEEARRLQSDLAVLLPQLEQIVEAGR